MDSSIGVIGLGRVGRSILRTYFIQPNKRRFNIKVLCDVMPISQVAYLLAQDSTYGPAPYPIQIEDDQLIINGHCIRYLQVDRRQTHKEKYFLTELKKLKLDILINATGVAQIDDLRHLISLDICKKILCSWNISGGDASLVYGVNQHIYDPDNHHIVSASTCTGNALAPLLMILDKHFGIEFSRIITIHPALSDQHILDGYHKHSHLGRTTAASVIPTSTNVADSTVQALPQLKGKLNSFSYRVPTEIVSIMDISAQLSQAPTLDDIKSLFTQYENNQLAGIIHCDNGCFGHEKVSIDFIGTEFSSIVLMNHLSVNNKNIGISVMHDNERGYCSRALDILNVMVENL